MEHKEDFGKTKDMSCAWISPEGDVHVFLAEKPKRTADVFCREQLGEVSVPMPEDRLLNSGWVRVRDKRVEFREWPTDRQYDRLREYGLTTSTPQDRYMFEVPNVKRVRDPFFRKDNYKGESWYEVFCMFNAAGVCTVSHDQVFAVREALARFGFATYTKDGGAEPGVTWILPDSKIQIELRRKISASLPEGNRYQFCVDSVEAGGRSIDNIVVGGHISGADEFGNYSELVEAAEQLSREAPEAGQIMVVSHHFIACSGETVDMPNEAVKMVSKYGADDFIALGDVAQVGRYDFEVAAPQ